MKEKSNLPNEVDDFLNENKTIRKTVIQCLADESVKNRLITFIGAGCSIFSGLPSWIELINNIKEKYEITTNESDLFRIATRIDKDVGSLLFREEIANQLKGNIPVSSLYKKIIRLSTNTFITTNYDHLLENAFRDNGIIPAVVSNDKDIPSIDPTKKTIVKLHGDIDSPSSIVISSTDYAKYKSQHLAFVNFLNSKATENTILFLGTSFNDSRLKEADDYVLKLFENFRRRPCIILKIPDYKNNISKEDYLIQFEDFKILYEEFKSKEFYVLIIEDYSEIEEILDKITNSTLEKKIKEDSSNLSTQLVLKTNYADKLEKKLAEECDSKVLELSKNVWGNGALPTQTVVRENADKLIDYLKEQDDYLNTESKLEGYITLTDVFLNLERRDNIDIAHEYFDKVTNISQKLKQKLQWEDRLSRITAKYYFYQGKIDDALKLIETSNDKKTVAFWISLLIEAEKFDEAYKFISEHGIEEQWLSESLYILVVKGNYSEADKKFKEFVDDFGIQKQNGKIESSSYKNEHYFDKVCAFIAEAYFRSAMKSIGKEEDVYQQDITEDARFLFEKAAEYAKKIFMQSNGESIRGNLKSYFFAYQSLIIRLQAESLVGNYSESDSLLKDIVKVKPIAQEAARYAVSRAGVIDIEIAQAVLNGLIRDFPNETWAKLICAILQTEVFKDYKKAWTDAVYVLDRTSDEKELQQSAGVIFELGFQTEKTHDAQKIINDKLPKENLWREYFNAMYLDISKQCEEAKKVIAEIGQKQPLPELSALCKHFMAEQAIKNNDYQTALRLLEESQKIHFNYPSLMKLLEVQIKLQNDVGSLSVIKDIEKFGISNDNIMHTKAIVLRNLAHFEEAASLWEILIKKYPHNSEIAYGYSELFAIQNKYNEALKIIEEFTSSNKINAKCLLLHVHILCALHKERDAFFKLEEHLKDFNDDYHILLQHLELGFKTGKEEKAHESFIRLEQLRQEGKLPDGIFMKKDIEDIKELIKKQREKIDELYKQYQSGKVPRHFFCGFNNIPMYLDWAFRTQKFSILPDWPDRREYVTYSTNSLRVRFEEGNQLLSIDMPEDTNKIVIDYTALITLHQLNLLKVLSKRFETIFYPFDLKNIMTVDAQRYKSHQATQEQVLNSLNNKFISGLITFIEVPFESSRPNTKADRDIRLSENEGIPLISAYIEKSDIPSNFSGEILRLHQLLSLLYMKGRISESKYQEIKKLIQDKEDFVKDAFENVLNNATKIIFDEITLELAEKFNLLEDIINSGFKIVVEKATYENIQFSIRSIKFSEDILKKQEDLELQLNNTPNANKKKLFEPIAEILNLNTNEERLHHYDVLLLKTVQYAGNKKLPLLTDDRFCQMMNSQYFGVDVLIKDLYARDMISLEQYANAFLKLCEWRYRFIFPEPVVIYYFAGEFKDNPLGKPLETLIKYSNECMEDIGLFYGFEKTDPPTTCATKFYMIWLDAWLRALIKIWADDSFDITNKETITQQILLRAFPIAPKGLNNNIKKNISSMFERLLSSHLFLATIELKSPEKLHPLFKYFFDSLNYSPDERVAALATYLEGSYNTLNKEENNVDLNRVVAIRALKGFYGNENAIIDERLVPVLKKSGVELTQTLIMKKDNVDNKSNIDIEKRILDTLLLRSNIERRSMSDFKPGPIVLIPPEENKEGEFILLHDLILADSLDMRKATIDKLLVSEYVSNYSKNIIKEKKEDILSIKSFEWNYQSKEVQNMLLKDFCYLQHWLKQLGDNRITEKNRLDFFNVALSKALDPNIETVFSNLPFLIRKAINTKDIYIKTITQAKNINEIHLFLDWYLDNVCFVPYNSKNSIYQILKSNNYEASHKGLTLECVKQWFSIKKEDPLAWLITLELVLSLRSESIPSQVEYKNKDFYDFLDNLLNTLFSFGKTKEKVFDDEIMLIKLSWNFRHEFAKYYLRFIDVNYQNEFDDERRVALAWWMAKETTTSLFHAVNGENKVDILTNILNKLNTQFTIMSFRHQFVDAKKRFSVVKYFLFNSDNLLGYATSALLVSENHLLLSGLKYPSDALSPEVRHVIVAALIEDMLSGKGQLEDDSKSLSLLWNSSLCKTAPDFLEKYYGDSFAFLGEDVHGKVMKAKEISEHAKQISTIDYLSSELNKIEQYLLSEDKTPIVLIINALKNFVMTHDVSSFPSELEIFSKNNGIVKEICKIEKYLAFFCCSSLLEILMELEIRKSTKYCEIFYKQFSNVDYSVCDERVLEIIAGYLFQIVIVGGKYEVLRPLLSHQNRTPIMRNLLSKMKSVLESLVPYTPLGSRDNLRRILNDLANI